MRLFTVGHSNRTAGDFLDLLRARGIGAVCDVRAFPRSRRWPQHDGEALAASLAAAGIAYHWLGRELGGYRRSRGPSRHTSLGDSAGFRAYADHMETAGFRGGVARLLSLARERPTAFLCAEKDWRTCHRRHLADYLVAIEGLEVAHIVDRETVERHPVDVRARVADGTLVYDRGRQTRLF